MARKHTRTRLLAGALISVVTAASLTLLAGPPASAAPSAPSNLQASGDPIPVLSWDRVDSATSYRVQGSENAGFSAARLQPEHHQHLLRADARAQGGHALLARPATDGTGTSGLHRVADQRSSTTCRRPVSRSPPRTRPPRSCRRSSRRSSRGTACPAPPATTSRWTPRATTSAARSRPTSRPRPTSGRTRRVSARRAASRTSSSGCGRSSTTACRRTGPSTCSTTSASCPRSPTTGTCPAGVLCAPEPGSPRSDRRATSRTSSSTGTRSRGAKQYEIWVSQDATFSNTPVDKRVVSGTRYSPKTTYGNADYYWKVRAINAAGSRSRGRRRQPVLAALAVGADARLPAQLGLDDQCRPGPLLPVDAGPARDALRAAGRHRRRLHPGHLLDLQDRADDVHGGLQATTRARAGRCGSARASIYYWKVRAHR